MRRIVRVVQICTREEAVQVLENAFCNALEHSRNQSAASVNQLDYCPAFVWLLMGIWYSRHLRTTWLKQGG